MHDVIFVNYRGTLHWLHRARDGIFMAQLALFNEGVPEHFPICGNFYEVFH